MCHLKQGTENIHTKLGFSDNNKSLYVSFKNRAQKIFRFRKHTYQTRQNFHFTRNFLTLLNNIN